MRRVILRIALAVVATVIVGTLAVFALLFYQGKRAPTGKPEYVALGSSYAAGLGLGDRAPGSPIACQRSVNGYPQRLARATGLSLVDMTCSGSTAAQIVHGGQFFQGAQLDAVAPGTKLVTLTSGGNDIAYIGDLMGMGYFNRGGIVGRIAGAVTHAPHPQAKRGLTKVQANLETAIDMIKARAPVARIVVVSYPAVLPERGTCAALGLTEQQVDAMRPVAESLAAATRAAARAGGATLVDLATLSSGHDACAAAPWTNGLAPASGAPFHPNEAGAQAAATAIAIALRRDLTVPAASY